MTKEKFNKLKEEAIRLANLLGNGEYWKIILPESIKQDYIGKKITADKSWK